MSKDQTFHSPDNPERLRGKFPLSQVPPDAECRFAGIATHGKDKGPDAFIRIVSKISGSIWWACKSCDSWHYPEEIIRKFGKKPKGGG